MPAHAAGIYDVDLTSPGEVSRWPQPHSGKAGRQIFCFELGPIELEIIDLERDHLVLLPLGHVYVLQHEVCAAEPEACEATLTPECGKAQLVEELDRDVEAGS